MESGLLGILRRVAADPTGLSDHLFAWIGIQRLPLGKCSEGKRRRELELFSTTLAFARNYILKAGFATAKPGSHLAREFVLRDFDVVQSRELQRD